MIEMKLMEMNCSQMEEDERILVWEMYALVIDWAKFHLEGFPQERFDTHRRYIQMTKKLNVNVIGEKSMEYVFF